MDLTHLFNLQTAYFRHAPKKISVVCFFREKLFSTYRAVYPSIFNRILALSSVYELTSIQQNKFKI